MLKKSVTFGVEAELYTKADVALKGLGMSMPQALTEYLEQIVKTSSPDTDTSVFVDEALEAYLEWF